MNQPHLVMFNPDQWRGDVVKHLGNRGAVTPTLDRLVATEAVSFRNAFCQNPVCTPSRCSFMTGWYPHTRGHRTMHHMLRPDEPCLLKTLKDSGYFVWWGGKNDLIPGDASTEAYCNVRFRPTAADYARWEHRAAPNLHTTAEQWRGAVGSDTYYSFYAGRLETGNDSLYFDHDWADIFGAVDHIRTAPLDRPLCIFLALSYPHPPYGVEEPWFSAIERELLPPRIPTMTDWTGKPSLLRGIADGQQLQGWTEDRWDELRATYYGMCARVDHQLGLIIAALRERGIWDDTALLAFSDHGDFTGDYGLVEKTQNTFEDCLTRVPFVVKPPKDRSAKAGVSDALIELIDLPATVMDLAGITPDYTQFGRSLLPVMSREAQQHRDAIFCEGGRLQNEPHASERASKTPPGGLYWPRLKVQLSDGVAHGKAVMCRTSRYKYIRRLYETDELYDIHSDPAELRNRISDPSLAGVVAEMKDRLLRFYQETADVVPHREDPR